MQVLIVHAHPEPQSFSTSWAQTAMSTLTENGHDVALSDLYQMSWNPTASAADFQDRADSNYMNYAIEQRHNWNANTLSDDITREVNKLLAADLVILNFPLYWFSTPAIMKGWIDRVLISGVVYGGKRIYEKAGLTGKRALITCTLGGRQDMFGADAIHGSLHDLLKHLIQGTLGYAGMTVLEPFFGFHVPYISDTERQQILEDYGARLNGIMNEDGLSMPDLSRFDSTFRPLSR